MTHDRYVALLAAGFDALRADPATDPVTVAALAATLERLRRPLVWSEADDSFPGEHDVSRR